MIWFVLMTLALAEDVLVTAAPAVVPEPTPPAEDPACKGLVQVLEDRMEGTTSYASAQPLVWSTSDQYGIVNMILRGPVSPMPNIWVMTAVGGSACIDETDKAIFLFRDGTRFSYENDVAFNCKGNFTVYLGPPFGKLDFAEKLISTDIEAVRIWTRGEYVEMVVTPAEALTLRNTFVCLYNPPGAK